MDIFTAGGGTGGKQRLLNYAGEVDLTVNVNAAGVRDDTGSVQEWLGLSNVAGLYYGHGTTTAATQFQVETNGNLTITGATATKATGTTWANPSDRRLKREMTDYALGLSAIAQLRPRAFVFNGKGGSTDGLQGYGLIADEVAAVFPEMVGTRRGKLDPADEAETDIQTLDTSTLVLALVNAVQELAARVAALEAA